MDINAIGEELYGVIVQSHPELAGKLTGMLMMLGADQCTRCLDEETYLAEKLDEAIHILDEATNQPEPKATSKPRPKPVEALSVRPDDEEVFPTLGTEPPKPKPKLRSKSRPKPDSVTPGAGPAVAAGLPEFAVKECIPGIVRWLDELKLSAYADAATNWVEENGAISLDEIVENLDMFSEDLNLKPLERNRIRKNAEDALRVALATDQEVTFAPVRTLPQPSCAAPHLVASLPTARSTGGGRFSSAKRASASAARQKQAEMEERRRQREKELDEEEAREETERQARERALEMERQALAQAERERVVREQEELDRIQEEIARQEEQDMRGPACQGDYPALTIKAPTRSAKAKVMSREELWWQKEVEKQEREYRKIEKARIAAEEAHLAALVQEEKREAKIREAEERQQRAAAALAAKFAESQPAPSAWDDGDDGEGWAAASTTGRKGKSRQ
uniref:PABC domain-containing protein n=1 Tax=Noctiluca scintillans TaxID=2966 RepID=A0A7S1AIK8_NOCSC